MTTLLITGGAGFLGQALLRELARPDAVLAPDELRVLDVRPVDVPGVVSLVGDVRDDAAVRRAVDGADVVLHAAALVDWGHHPEHVLHAVNVEGTDRVIAAARDAGVRALVATSSLDVVYDGRAVVDGDESLPYGERFPNAYCSTKAEAERRVRAADGSVGAAGVPLRTVALRACGMFGEADPYHVSHVLRLAAKGPLFRIGDGSARSQHVYVGNVAHAHLVAAARLLHDGAGGGAAYFVTDHPAENFFDFLEPVVTACGHRMRPWSQALPYRAVYALGAAADGLAWAVSPVVRWVPGLSRFAVDFVCKDFTFRGERLRDELGYAPVYGKDEALARTIAWFRAHGPVGS